MAKRAACFLLVALAGCVPEIRVAASDASNDRSDVSSIVFDSDSGVDVVLGKDSSTGLIDRPADTFVPTDRPDRDSPDADASSDRGSVSDALASVEAAVDAVAATDVGCLSCALTNATSACRLGACVIERCNDGFGDCNGAVADGCETALNTSTHCGACGGACGSGVCSSRSCVRQRSCAIDSDRGCGLLAVPGDRFSMGSVEGAGGALDGRVSVSLMFADTHEVTVRRFRQFWNAGHPSPAGPIRYPNGTALTVDAATEPLSSISGSHCNWTALAGGREDQPINCVDWATAQSFCFWDGGRLPTEAEWEYLSRHRNVPGISAPRDYPWGDAPPVEMFAIYPRPTPCERAQFQNCVGDDGVRTRRVGSFSATGGLFDLAGNVAEWVADRPDTYGIGPCWSPTPVDLRDPICVNTDIGRSVRGGGFRTAGPAPLMGAARDAQAATSHEDILGFRCVRSP